MVSVSNLISEILSFSFIPLFFPNIAQGDSGNDWEESPVVFPRDISERDTLHFLPSPFLWSLDSSQASRQNLEDMRAWQEEAL